MARLLFDLKLTLYRAIERERESTRDGEPEKARERERVKEIK